MSIGAGSHAEGNGGEPESCSVLDVRFFSAYSFIVVLLGLLSLASCSSNNEFNSELPFTAISSALDHSCGIRPDRTVTCWGENHVGQLDAP